MNEIQPHAVLSNFVKNAHINEEQYQSLYQESIHAPAEFWAKQAKQFITWFTPWTDVFKGDFTTLNLQWYSDATLNACYNCVDRHLKTRGNQVAIIWEGNSPNETQS